MLGEKKNKKDTSHHRGDLAAWFSEEKKMQFWKGKCERVSLATATASQGAIANTDQMLFPPSTKVKRN